MYYSTISKTIFILLCCTTLVLAARIPRNESSQPRRRSKGLKRQRPSDLQQRNAKCIPRPDTSTVKKVVAHFMVGNTSKYTPATWLKQIRMAVAQGIDAFVLNVGVTDSWTETQLASAYSTSVSSGSGFKMFISFDAVATPCNVTGADLVRKYIGLYANHPAQLKDTRGRAYVSTFGGEGCNFGRESVDAGWRYVTKDGLPPTAFLPSFFKAPVTFASEYPTSLDGYFLWNGGWSFGNHVANWTSDADAILGTRNGRADALYMAAVSPWFFTHYKAANPGDLDKNWIYRGDDWNYIKRWEDVITHRNDVDLVQVLSWNDYGESHYIGPIESEQPASNAWVDGFDHNGWLKLVKYYAHAFKYGSYPAIKKDQIFLWARPHGKDDVAPDDLIGKPTRAEFATDNLWAVLFSTCAGTLTLTSGSNSGTFPVVAGVNKFKLPQAVGGVSAKLVRAGATLFNFHPAGFNFTHSPKAYNFNAFVASYP